MNKPILSAALLMTATGLCAMHVVVIATDMHVVQYVADCNGQLWMADQPIRPHDRAWHGTTGAWRATEGTRAAHRLNGVGADQLVVATPSRIRWHVVGGVPPYQLIEDQRDLNGVCITVRDALGNEATGCAVVQVRRTQVMVDCPLQFVEEAIVPTPKTVDKEPRGVRAASTGAGTPRGNTRVRDGRHTGDGGTRTATYRTGGTRNGEGGGSGGGGTPGGTLTRGTSVR